MISVIIMSLPAVKVNLKVGCCARITLEGATTSRFVDRLGRDDFIIIALGGVSTSTCFEGMDSGTIAIPMVFNITSVTPFFNEDTLCCF